MLPYKQIAHIFKLCKVLRLFNVWSELDELYELKWKTLQMIILSDYSYHWYFQLPKALKNQTSP